jgi:hypothetical protein
VTAIAAAGEDRVLANHGSEGSHLFLFELLSDHKLAGAATARRRNRYG